MTDALRQDLSIDLVAFDKRDQPILAVEVKAMTGVVQTALDWIVWLETEVRPNGRPIPYWMFVGLDSMIIFSQGDGSNQLRDPICIPTARVLSAYDPEFEGKRIFDDYLLALVEAWLRDFAFDWRSASPPLMKELNEIGLADRLKGGMTYREVPLADPYCAPLRGNQFRDEPFPWAGPGD